MLYKLTREDVDELRFAFVKDEMIQNHLNWKNWQRVSSKDVLMKIKSLDYSKKTALAVVMVMAMGTMTGAPPATAMETATGKWKVDQKEFWDLWNKNQSIPGNVFLHPNGRLIWISCVDLKYFEKINNPD